MYKNFKFEYAPESNEWTQGFKQSHTEKSNRKFKVKHTQKAVFEGVPVDKSVIITRNNEITFSNI